MTVDHALEGEDRSRPPPLTSASASAAAWIARPRPASVQPGRSRRARSTCQSSMPRRCASCAGAAAGPATLRHGAQLHGERRDHRHGVGAGGERVTQRDERLAVAAGDRRVGDGEREPRRGRRSSAATVSSVMSPSTSAISCWQAAASSARSSANAETRRAARAGRCACAGGAELARGEVELSPSRLSSAQTISMPPPVPARIASSSFLPRTPPPWRSTRSVSSAGASRYEIASSRKASVALLDAGRRARAAARRTATGLASVSSSPGA